MTSDLKKGAGPDLRKMEDIGGNAHDGETSRDVLVLGGAEAADAERADAAEDPGQDLTPSDTDPEPDFRPAPVMTVGQKLKRLFRRGAEREPSLSAAAVAEDTVAEDTPVDGSFDPRVEEAEGVLGDQQLPLLPVTREPEPVPDMADPETPAPAPSKPQGPRFRLFGRRKGEPSNEAVEVEPVPEPEKGMVTPPLADLPAVTAPARPSKASIIRSAGKKKGRDPRGYPPIQVLIGWIGESSRKDVLEHARGFATDHIEALDTAWITMAEFRGGTLFEVHEGGGGAAYLPEIIEELSRDPDQVIWVPSGTKLNRVVTVSIVEDRPFSMMLNEADSARVRASGQRPIERAGRMRRLRPRGTGVLVAGGTLFAVAFGALATSAFLSSRIDQQPIPSLPYSAETLPHGQIIGLSDALREDRWVSRILFENGSWRAEFETFDELTLPEDTGEAQQLIDEAVERDGILQAERERKVRELGAE